MLEVEFTGQRGHTPAGIIVIKKRSNKNKKNVKNVKKCDKNI